MDAHAIQVLTSQSGESDRSEIASRARTQGANKTSQQPQDLILPTVPGGFLIIKCWPRGGCDVMKKQWPAATL